MHIFICISRSFASEKNCWRNNQRWILAINFTVFSSVNIHMYVEWWFVYESHSLLCFYVYVHTTYRTSNLSRCYVHSSVYCTYVCMFQMYFLEGNQPFFPLYFSLELFTISSLVYIQIDRGLCMLLTSVYVVYM